MADTASPQSPPPATPDARDEPTGPRSPLIAVSTAVAWVAVLLFVASAVTFALPVDNPGVQHCGAPAMFLVHGTQDADLYDKQGNAINHYDQAQLRHAYDNRCSKAVAARAVPAAALGVGFVVLGLLALVLALIGHRSTRVRDLRSAMEDQVGRTTSSGVPM